MAIRSAQCHRGDLERKCALRPDIHLRPVEVLGELSAFGADEGSEHTLALARDEPVLSDRGPTRLGVAHVLARGDGERSDGPRGGGEVGDRCDAGCGDTGTGCLSHRSDQGLDIRRRSAHQQTVVVGDEDEFVLFRRFGHVDRVPPDELTRPPWSGAGAARHRFPQRGGRLGSGEIRRIRRSAAGRGHRRSRARQAGPRPSL